MNTMAISATRSSVVAGSKTKGILAYLLITFGLAWLAWIPLWISGMPQSSGIFSVIMMIGVSAPAFGTLVVRQWVTREGFADAGLRPNLRRAWGYYLFAWLWPLLVFAALSTAMLFGLSTQKDVSREIVPALLSGLAMTPVLWLEEFGWRSYLQMRLFGGRPLLAALATGAIWGVWHYPMVLTGYLPNHNGIAGLVFFPAYTMLFSILLGWLRMRTGSIWVVSLAHASHNMVLEAIAVAVFGTMISNGDLFLDPRGLVALVPLCGLCAWIVLGGRFGSGAAAPAQAG